MVLLTAVLALTSRAQAGIVEVPFRRVEDAFIVDAVVNGRPVSLMFDTGFSGTIVANDTLDLGKSTGNMTLRDFVGEFQAKTVKVTSLKLGAQTINPTGKEIVQQPMGHITDSYGVHCDGIMGLETIKDYVTEINFQRSRFIFYPKTMDISTRTPDNQKTYLVKMLLTGHNAIELSCVASTGKKLTLALDTGNAFYATTHKDVLTRVGLWDADKEAKFQKLSGVASGTVASWSYRMKDAKIFGVPVKESFWDVIDAPSSSAEADGTVGYGFLSNFNVTLDYERRRVWLENYTGKVANESLGDIGISAGFDPSVKRARVFLVAPDSPAEKAGIKAGDTLLSVNGVDAGETSFADLRKMFEGPVDSKVTVATSRNGTLNRQELVRKQLVNE